MSESEFPLLGFPHENEDLRIRQDGANRAVYSCRPVPGMVALVEACVAHPEKWWIGLVKEGAGEPHDSLQLADCPLQAIAFIKNFIDTYGGNSDHYHSAANAA
jgi:hypothetical protein